MGLLVFSLSSYAEDVEPRAEMVCKLFNTRVENGSLKESELLLTKKNPAFYVTFAVFMQTQFPPPYENVTVSFNHMLSGYRETDNVMSPYVQAFFKKDGTRTGDVREVSFDLGNALTGSKITLRGYLNYSSTSLLTYQCSFIYL